MTLATLPRRPRSAQRRSSSSPRARGDLGRHANLVAPAQGEVAERRRLHRFPDDLEDERRRAVQSREIILQ